MSALTVGSYVTSEHRVSPFRTDEVLVIEELKNVGTHKRPVWRARCVAANRAVSGWLDLDMLVPYGGWSVDAGEPSTHFSVRIESGPLPDRPPLVELIFCDSAESAKRVARNLKRRRGAK